MNWIEKLWTGLKPRGGPLEATIEAPIWRLSASKSWSADKMTSLSLFPHDKSRVFHWTLCDMLTWQICHRLCHHLAQKWRASVHKDHWESENKENTGIFVFSRVCPCVSDKQTDKQTCLSVSFRQTDKQARGIITEGETEQFQIFDVNQIVAEKY